MSNYLMGKIQHFSQITNIVNIPSYIPQLWATNTSKYHSSQLKVSSWVFSQGQRI
ncbi:hypothetical protein RintRC_4766 [Richelia intracellularis]|nr:hypothetical protein RintRC_4766 [Richelia intracellularis]